MRQLFHQAFDLLLNAAQVIDRILRQNGVSLVGLGGGIDLGHEIPRIKAVNCWFQHSMQ